MVPVTTSAFARFIATHSSATLSIAPGIDTPLSFGDASREHLATRRAAGLFDFSFMGCVEITGAGSRPFLEALQTRSIAALARGRIAYTLLLRDDASVLIDATVWHLDTDHYWLFVGRRGDIDYISHAARGYAVTLADKSRQHAVIAVQGDASRSIIARALGAQPAPILSYAAQFRRRRLLARAHRLQR
jgi:aminomethyltransferase